MSVTFFTLSYIYKSVATFNNISVISDFGIVIFVIFTFLLFMRKMFLYNSVINTNT
jgi:hypothetical protein